VVVFLGKLIRKVKKAAGGLVKSPAARSAARVAVPVAGVSLAVLLARRRARSRSEVTGGGVRDRRPHDKKSR
jgi:hypothetical protein